MKIAIIGSGLAGLAAAWYLAKKNVSITVFDQGGSASRSAAGLVHPYSSRRLTEAIHGHAAFQEALSLFEEAKNFSKEDFILHRGLVRLSDEGQENAQSFHKDLIAERALFVKEALTIDTNLYLDALTAGLRDLGVVFLRECAHEGFDVTVIAAGYKTLEFAENLPFKYLKGQGVEVELPHGMDPLEYAFSSDIYVVSLKDRRRIFAGSTFERGISDPEPDESVVRERILPRLGKLFPRLAGCQPVAIRSGVRLTTEGYFPLVKEIRPRVWVFSGLGSKGLLYHAYLGKELTSQLFSSARALPPQS